MRRIAALLLRAPDEYVERRGSRFAAADRSVSLEEVCLQAYGGASLGDAGSPGLEASAAYDPQDFTFPVGAHLAFVTVDPETGQVRIEKLVAAQDAGRLYDPPSARSRLSGGAVQGASRALLVSGRAFEGDAIRDGDVLAEAPVDALRSPEIPDLACEWIEDPTGAGAFAAGGPLGAKGIGASGASGCLAAVANAVLDALSTAGVRHIDLPLSPERVWRALRLAAEGCASETGAADGHLEGLGEPPQAEAAP
jgi:carbon-monoxide dehydrogenase large subunit